MRDPEGIVTFRAGGETFTAVFGFRAIKATEVHFDKAFALAIVGVMPTLSPEDLNDKAKVAEAGARVKLGDIGKLFEFALLKHHPDVTETVVEEIIDELGLAKVADIIGEALASSMDLEGDDSSTENPPRKKPARRTG